MQLKRAKVQFIMEKEGYTVDLTAEEGSLSMGQQRNRQPINGRYLAGLLNGRGTIEVAYVVKNRRCHVEPDMAWNFSPEDAPTAEAVVKLTGARAIPFKPGGQRVMLSGFGPIARVGKDMLPFMHNPVQKCRLKVVVERAGRPRPTVCTPGERAAPRGKLTEVFFKGCPKPRRP